MPGVLYISFADWRNGRFAAAMMKDSTKRLGLRSMAGQLRVAEPIGPY